MIRIGGIFFLLTGLLAGAALPGPARAADTRFETDFTITLRGLTVARAGFTGTVDGDRFEIDGKLASAGLARIFSRTDATAHTSGRISSGTVRPDSFLMDYAQDGRSSKTAIAFRNGDAVSTDVEPKPKAPSKKIIPITAEDLKSVADPVAATLLARGTADEICGRTLRIYEGGTRIDVQLSPKATGFVYGAGNRAVTCAGRFIPVAGMERGNKTYDFMRDKADMEFVYAPAGPDGLYMLYALSARTEIGTVRLRAWRRKVE